MKENRCSSYACLQGCALGSYCLHQSSKHPDELAVAFETFADCPNQEELREQFKGLLSDSEKARSRLKKEL